MSQAEILETIKLLSGSEQIAIAEATRRLVREELASSPAASGQSLRAATAAMRAEYEQDRDLTALTALDSEDFHLAGELWLVNLDQTVGTEFQETCPVVIVNDDAIGILPLKIVVPGTDWKDRYAVASWVVRIDLDAEHQLPKPSKIDTFQVRSITL